MWASDIVCGPVICINCEQWNVFALCMLGPASRGFSAGWECKTTDKHQQNTDTILRNRAFLNLKNVPVSCQKLSWASAEKTEAED